MAVRRRTQLLHLVNRTTRELNCMHDGIPYKIRPGYIGVDKDGHVVECTIDEKGRVSKGIKVVPAKALRDNRGRITGFVPELDDPEAQPYFEQFEYHVARAACLQNKRSGSENPLDPREFDSLCGVLEWDNDVDHVENLDGEALDRSQLDPRFQKTVTIGGMTKRVKARRRFNIEQYGGGSGNPTGAHIPNHPGL